MIRNLVLTLAAALALGFVLGPPQGKADRCNRPTTGVSRVGKILWRDSCVLAHHPSKARLLPEPRIWSEGAWPAVVSRGLVPWLTAGLVAGIVSGSLGRAAGSAGLATLANFLLFLWLSVRGGLSRWSEISADLRATLSDFDLAGPNVASYLRAEDLLGFGIGLAFALLGAVLGSIRVGRAKGGLADLDERDESALDSGKEQGAAERVPLGSWLTIGWRLALRDLRGAAVRLEDAGHARLALKLYRKADLEEEAALLCEQRGMVFSAAHLFAKIGQPEAGAAALERAGYCLRAAAEYEKAGRFEDAGRCLVRAGDLKEAADVYRRGGLYDKAAQIYLESGEYLVAARCYAKVGEYGVAARIAEEQGAFREASEYFERMRDWESAAECLGKAGDPEGADRMIARKERESLGPPTRIEGGASRRPGQRGKKGGDPTAD